MNLKDNWAISGNDLDGFISAMRMMDKQTEYRYVNTSELSIMSYGYETGKKFLLYKMSSDGIDEFNNICSGDAFDICDVAKEDTDCLLVEETLNDSGIMIGLEDDIYTVSETALCSIFNRAGVNGSNLYKNSTCRNIFLAESLHRAGLEYTGGTYKNRKSRSDYNCIMISRVVKENGIAMKKLFYMPTEKYKVVPLSTLSVVAETIIRDKGLGRTLVKSWKTNHFISEITLVFPDLEKDIADAYHLEDSFLPGLVLRNSCTGKCCFEARGVMFIGGNENPFVVKTHKMKHSTDVGLADFVDACISLVRTCAKPLPDVLSRLAVFDRRVKKTDVLKYTMSCSKKGRVTSLVGKKRELIWKEKATLSEGTSLYHMAVSLMTELINITPESAYEDVSIACINFPQIIEKTYASTL